MRPEQEGHADMKEPLSFGVIGCGTWGQAHAEIFAGDRYTRLGAVCDLDIERARELGTAHGAPFYDDFEEMLDREKLDGVGIATPDFAHGKPLVAAVSRGKHVLCEKPLVTDPAELDDVVNAVVSSGVRVMVDYHNRWNVPFVKAKKRLSEGVLGRPVNGYMRLTDIQWVPKNYISWASQSSILWFLGSHTVDTMSWLFGDRVSRVYSVARSGILKEQGVDTVDVYMSTLEYEGGGIAQIENGWITPDSNPFINDFKFNLLCTEGMVNVDLSSSNFFEIYTREKIEHPDFLVKPRVHGYPSGFSYESIRDFIRRLYFDEEFVVPFDDSVNVNRVLFAILESADRGVPVDVVY
jgi:predicted dehydrogenase